jgi:hypothetical protein
MAVKDPAGYMNQLNSFWSALGKSAWGGAWGVGSTALAR